MKRGDETMLPSEADTHATTDPVEPIGQKVRIAIDSIKESSMEALAESVEKGVSEALKNEEQGRKSEFAEVTKFHNDEYNGRSRSDKKTSVAESLNSVRAARRMTLKNPDHRIASLPYTAPVIRFGGAEQRLSNENLAVQRSDEYWREYDHMVTVEFKLTFLKINDIDTLSQQFEAEVYVQSKWEEPALAGLDSEELDKLLPCDLWDPQLIIVNIAGDFDQEIRSFVVRYEQGYKNPVVLHRWRFKGLFRKALELRHFPFDVQDLTIQLSTERSFEEIKMTHDKQQLSSVNTRTFQDSQEWSIYNHVQCDYRNTTVQYASSTIHPILVFSCRVRRRVGYFMWNIVFIVFLVLMLSLLSVAIEPASSDRLASTMTLFLTMVAFKLVVKQSLPTISYLTYLDIYVLGSLIYLVLYAMENSAMISMGRWLDSELVEAYDEFFCMFLGAILVLFHLIFIIHIQVTALKRHREMRENDRHYALQARALAMKQFGSKRKSRQYSKR